MVLCGGGGDGRGGRIFHIWNGFHYFSNVFFIIMKVK